MTPALPIATARLVLRDFSAHDWQALHGWACDPEVTARLEVSPFDGEAARTYVRRMLASQVERPRRRWELAMICRREHRLIGACGLMTSRDEGTLGYVLARTHWGCGYATEGASALIALGFRHLRLQRIGATCAPGHVASAAVLAKLGFERTRPVWWRRLRSSPWAFELTPAAWAATSDGADALPRLVPAMEAGHREPSRHAEPPGSAA